MAIDNPELRDTLFSDLCNICNGVIDFEWAGEDSEVTCPTCGKVFCMVTDGESAWLEDMVGGRE